VGGDEKRTLSICEEEREWDLDGPPTFRGGRNGRKKNPINAGGQQKRRGGVPTGKKGKGLNLRTLSGGKKIP